MFDVEEVFAKLTLKEKCDFIAGKDNWHTVDFPAHNVPSLRTSDGPNGVRGTRFFDGVPAANFPCGTGMASTFDQEMIEHAGKIMGVEAKAKSAHILLGPTANMQRSPLGGRGFESFSEDPVLSGLMAAAEIRGIQSEGIQATIKHFVGNDQEDDRLAVNNLMTERALREIYMLPFQIAVRDANPGAFMTAYNKVNGHACSENKKLLTDTLRDDWGYDGIVMSDWVGTYSCVPSVEAGLDLEMPGVPKWRGRLLYDAVSTKMINQKYVDDAVLRLLKFVKKAAVESGITGSGEKACDTPETAKFLEQIASDSIVLLKNENNILPLSKEKTTAVIGPNAKVATFSGGGSASLRPYYVVSPYDGISKKLNQKPKFSLGVSTYKMLPLLGYDMVNDEGKLGFTIRTYDGPRTDPDRKLIDTRYLEDSNMFMADYFPEPIKDGWFWVDLIGYFTPDEDGKYDFGLCVNGTAKLYIDDELVVDNEDIEQLNGPSFMGSGTPEEVGSKYLKAGQTYKITTYYTCGKAMKAPKIAGLDMFNGGLRLGYVKDEGHVKEIAKAVEIAKTVDNVILCVGLNSGWESEGFDRDTMNLPDHVDELVQAVVAVNPNTIVVNQSGVPVAMPWADKVPAILQAWYGGNETGTAIANVIFGDVNPSGKLSLSFPKRLEDNPSFTSFGSENGRVLYNEDIFVGYRGYEKSKIPVLFPFGHGLSYTSFEIVDSTLNKSGESIDVAVSIKNTGQIDGKAVIQIYVSAPAQKGIRRPVKELKGFAKTSISAGETQTVSIKLSTKYATSYWNEYVDKWESSKGTYKVHIGQSSAEIEKTLEFDVEKTSYWLGL